MAHPKLSPAEIQTRRQNIATLYLHYRSQIDRLREKEKNLLADWKVPIFLDTLSMGQLILPAVHYRRHF